MDNNISPNSDTQADKGEQPQSEGTKKADNGTVTSPDALSEFLGRASEVVGTKFDSPDKFLDSVKNLNKLVGDQTVAEARKKAEQWEFVDKKLSTEAKSNGFDSTYEYLQYLDETGGQTQAIEKTDVSTAQQWKAKKQEAEVEGEKDKRLSDMSKKLEKLERKDTLNEFKSRFGEKSTEFYDGVVAWGQMNGIKDPFVAYEKSPFKALVEADSDRQATSVIETNSRVKSVAGDYQKDREQAIQSGDWATFLRKHGGIGSVK